MPACWSCHLTASMTNRNSWSPQHRWPACMCNMSSWWSKQLNHERSVRPYIKPSKTHVDQLKLAGSIRWLQAFFSREISEQIEYASILYMRPMGGSPDALNWLNSGTYVAQWHSGTLANTHMQRRRHTYARTNTDTHTHAHKHTYTRQHLVWNVQQALVSEQRHRSGSAFSKQYPSTPAFGLHKERHSSFRKSQWCHLTLHELPNTPTPQGHNRERNPPPAEESCNMVVTHAPTYPCRSNTRITGKQAMHQVGIIPLPSWHLGMLKATCVVWVILPVANYLIWHPHRLQQNVERIRNRCGTDLCAFARSGPY